MFMSIATGDIPESRELSCITSAYGGKKLVVASGASTQSMILSHVYVQHRGYEVFKDVFLYDVETSIWTMGENSTVGHVGGACAVSGDYLLDLPPD
ncbi:hypothetical protein BG000_004264 [Podila horticola]|nr:hypothetical protein BG000_004264 [Podila horticola]